MMAGIDIPKTCFEINPWMFVRKLIVLATIAALCGGFVLIAQGSLGSMLALPAQVILGLIFAVAVEMQHQCLHYTAFRSGRHSKQLHRIIGFLLGLPMLSAFTHYQERHLWHHRWLGTPKDTEFFSYNRSFQSWPSLLLQAFSLRRYVKVFRQMLDAVCGRTCPDVRNSEQAKRIRQEYCLMAALLVGAGALSLAFHSLLIVKLWLIPLIISAETAHALIELPEHYGCDTQTRDVFRNTRTVVSNRFFQELTHFNGFHVGHHIHAGIPLDKLKDLQPIIAPHSKYVVQSYLEFFRSIVVRRPKHVSNTIPPGA